MANIDWTIAKKSYDEWVDIALSPLIAEPHKFLLAYWRRYPCCYFYTLDNTNGDYGENAPKTKIPARLLGFAGDDQTKDGEPAAHLAVLIDDDVMSAFMELKSLPTPQQGWDSEVETRLKSSKYATMFLRPDGYLRMPAKRLVDAPELERRSDKQEATIQEITDELFPPEK
jgi:hypothetical protein